MTTPLGVSTSKITAVRLNIKLSRFGKPHPEVASIDELIVGETTV